MSRLVGAPPGYVGYDQGGQLTEAVRRHPYSVVLLDEMEKAHADVWSVLLQVLDDGRLTDGQGRTVDFKNTVDHHDEQRRQPAPAQADQRQPRRRSSSATMRELQTHVPPRVPEPDRRDHLLRAARARPSSARSSGSSSRGSRSSSPSGRSRIHLADQAVARIAEAGYDPIYGARPLKRALQKLVIDPLATHLLVRRLRAGRSRRRRRRWRGRDRVPRRTSKGAAA